MQALILSIHTLDPWGWVKRSNIFFLNVVMLHIKLKGKKYRPTEKQKLWPYTHPWPLGRVERSDIEIVQINNFFIELSTKNS